ncbi:MAG: hypothetical protein HYX53_17875 [Chloroflexi bacterium]|nr:hypothetical protein [Chloroflexota bacterium]
MSKQLMIVLALVLPTSFLAAACDAAPASAGFGLDETGRLQVFTVLCTSASEVIAVRLVDTGAQHVANMKKSSEVTIWQVQASEVAGTREPFTVGVTPVGFEEAVALARPPSNNFLRAYITNRSAGGRTFVTSDDVKLTDLRFGKIKAESKFLSTSEFLDYARTKACAK